MRGLERHDIERAPDGAGLLPNELDCGEVLRAIEGYALTVDHHRRIRWVNRSPRGLASASFVGRELGELIEEHDRATVITAVDRVLTGRPPIELEARGALTGRWHRLRIVGLVKRDTVLGCFVHAIDIEDGKRIERELSLEHARRAGGTGAGEPGIPVSPDDRRRFEVMADALPVLIAYVDTHRRYQYNNAAYERWFGTSKEGLRGRSVEDVLGKEAFEEIAGYVDAALSGRAVTFERSVPYKNAGYRRIVARYVPDFTEHGDVVGFHALVEDVTARREAEGALRHREEELRQLQKMEALGRLAGGIAHDFNSLLATVVLGCTAVLQGVASTSQASQAIARIQRAARRGMSLTRQLLAFSRREELETGPLDLDLLISDIRVLLERLVEGSVSLEVQLGARAEIVADAGQIQQVLMNLVINARDAMPDGGRLQVATTRVEVSESLAGSYEHLVPGSHVVLAVADTGIGMDGPTKERIFDPFFTTKAPGQGTGLGLSTVFGIVQQSGGHIEVESTPGRGTTFRLYFPIASGAAAGEPSVDH